MLPGNLNLRVEFLKNLKVLAVICNPAMFYGVHLCDFEGKLLKKVLQKVMLSINSTKNVTP